MDAYQFTQFPEAFGGFEQFLSEEPVAFPEYTFPSLQQVGLPTAPVPYGNYHYQGGQYAPQQYTPGAWSATSNANTSPSMMAPTPSTVSPATIPAAAFGHQMAPQMAPQMQAPQAHRQPQPQQQQQQQQQRPAAAVKAGHVCPSRDDWEDMAALISLCEYSNKKGKHGESCEDVGDVATEAAIREYRSGNPVRAKANFHRLASKNLNQKIHRAERAEMRKAARRNP